MSRAGMNTARQHGESLPSSQSLSEAERALFGQRDGLLASLIAAAQTAAAFRPTFDPSSLKTLEQWYFDLAESDSFEALGLTRDVFERAMAMYFGETVVRTNPEFCWYVEEYVFTPGKYEIGVRKPLVAISLQSFGDLRTRPNNKRRQSMWREFHRYAR